MLAWVNGTIGTISGLSDDGIMYVVTEDGKEFDVHKESWSNVRYRYNETEKKILNLLLTNKTLSNKQIRESLNVTKYESITALNSLMEKAYIEKTGEGAGTKYIFKYSDDIKGYKILENINDIFMSLKREILK